MIWRCRERSFDLSSDVLVMGVLNVTPDSFSDGGKFLDPKNAVRHGVTMAEAGAAIIDIGGESSRPGAVPVPADEEIRRVVPVIETLRPRTKAAISIDTTKAVVARAAISAGADIVNDITALRGDPAMADEVAKSGAGVILMHMQGEPATMQVAPHYADVVREVIAFLLEREASAIGRGIQRDQIAFDPGIGFGKTFEHNLEIFHRMEEFAKLGRPLVVGASRKNFLRRLASVESSGAKIRDHPPDSPAVADATAAAVTASILRGASVVRVHDVGPMVRVARVAQALR